MRVSKKQEYGDILTVQELRDVVADLDLDGIPGDTKLRIRGGESQMDGEWNNIQVLKGDS